jgi:hypothetical protein
VGGGDDGIGILVGNVTSDQPQGGVSDFSGHNKRYEATTCRECQSWAGLETITGYGTIRL